MLQAVTPGITAQDSPLLDSPVAGPPSPQEPIQPLADGIRRSRSRSATPADASGPASDASPQRCAPFQSIPCSIPC